MFTRNMLCNQSLCCMFNIEYESGAVLVALEKENGILHLEATLEYQATFQSLSSQSLFFSYL